MKVALEHRTTYRFDRPVALGPHVLRLRPAPHTRTPIEAYTLRVSPAEHYLHWQQDPFGNRQARVVFPGKSAELDIAVGLVADLRVINPFDFFVEPYAESAGFAYPADLATGLRPYLEIPEPTRGPVLDDWLAGLPRPVDQSTVLFLGALNSAVRADVGYSTRMEPGVHGPDETLTNGIGSCRDSAWLLVNALRHFGLAARFVSGYLVQLGPDDSPDEDVTDLHAWAEAYVPGAGWIGLDPTSALFAGEGHIPLAATPDPAAAAPVTGATEPAGTTLTFANTVVRLDGPPQTSHPYTSAQTDHLDRLGLQVDARLADAGLELTMGGEPTFVSAEDLTSPQWRVDADGPEKRVLAGRLGAALYQRYAAGGLVQHGQGKWYPGEDRPRWQVGLVWRTDGEPLWRDPARLADPDDPAAADDDAVTRAEALARAITADLGLPESQLRPCFEDPLARLAAEVRRPDGAPPEFDPAYTGPDLVAELDGAETEPAAWVLPLVPSWFGDGWASPDWRTRRGRLVLVPGDLPAGARLPLDSLSWHAPDFAGEESYLRADTEVTTAEAPLAVVVDAGETEARTALVVQARDGLVHVFLPPLEQLGPFCELVQILDRAVTRTAGRVVVEGYGPPPDPRVRQLLITPDPGVIEVNVHPTSSWPELAELTRTLYAVARDCGLTAETFAVDGRQTGTGGGSHLTLGGPDPARSPMLTRPDLLISLLTFWQHHPSLSYLFSGRFVGSTSQAPRVDEGRPEALYELETAFAEITRLSASEHLPWLLDRALRPLLADVTGNAHRSEFCVDKLYNPDALRGRLGLLELRGFEMAPHPDMALVQALLVRALVARSAADPYAGPLVRWGTSLHERFLLPHYCVADLAEVVADLRAHDLDLDLAWFGPFVEFRFPRIGVAMVNEVELELRVAGEPWSVLAQDAASGGTARYVDSSTERLQVRVTGFAPARHLLTCNGQAVPLTATGTPGTYVAGVRYRAWQPWSALHPSLPIDAPLGFDLVDRARAVAVGGATYAVVDPGGRAYDQPPVNAAEAEARRGARFTPVGRTTGVVDVAALDAARAWRGAEPDEYPITLDLRRRRPPALGPRVTVLARYLADESAALANAAFDELAGPDGTVRAGWSVLLDKLADLAPADLVRAQREVARLLADDNVTYTPSPTSAISMADPAGVVPPAFSEPRPWRLDPLPLILDDREWSGLEAGVVQRAELLDAILADLYGARRLLARQAIPAAAVLDHDEYLRSMVGVESLAGQRLFLAAADLGRDGTGQWKVISDRTQAPSGAGFAMQNRRVVSRVLPDIYAAANLHRLTPFFSAMRLALVDAAPHAVEDPRVVVLSPGTASETAFDQAFVASLLGFPLLEGSDLTVRDGRVWMRSLGKLEPVDVILRRVDSTWMDALELRPGSRLGVTGLLECVRQGSVSVVNSLGSGVLENPALLPFLPELCVRLLGEPLRLPSVDTWWCGDEASLSHVLAHLDKIVVRPISRGHGRSVLGAALTAAQRERLATQLRAAPHRYVGQEVLHLSSVPTTSDAALVRRNLVLRAFAVRSGASYTAMLGGLAQVTDDRLGRRGSLVTDPGGGLAKDVWVVSREPVVAARVAAPRGRVGDEAAGVATGSSSAMVPRVLSDLFWFGRYAERAEDLLRLVLATQRVAIETDTDVAPDRPLPDLLAATTHVSTAYPGFLRTGVEVLPELRALLLDRHRAGTVAQSVAALTTAAQGVRDQLSEDVWIVLAEIDRARAALAADPNDQGLQLTATGEQMLSGLLALAGIGGENMVRDPGWYLLDSGRGLERALQVVALLRVTLTPARPAEAEGPVIEAVLTAAESIVTFRRRYRGRTGVEAVTELLVTDVQNPRSVAYQLRRMVLDLRAVPGTSPNARPLRLLDSLTEKVRTADLAALAEVVGGRRPALEEFLTGLGEQLRSVSEAVRDQYLQAPPDPQPMFGGWDA